MIGLVGYVTTRDRRPVAIAMIIEGFLIAAGIAPAWLLTPEQMRRKRRECWQPPPLLIEAG